nr:uncharacterized protein LOC117221479 [Megalopta genalis]
MNKETFSCFFLVLLFRIAHHGITGKKHVHLRIHVPDMIEHRFHTKVVFIHEPPPKKPKTDHKEYRRENWSSWSYGNHRDSKHRVDEEDREDRSERERLATSEPRDPNGRKIHGPGYGRHGDPSLPQSHLDDNRLEENPKIREHGGYEVREEADDVPRNGETLVYDFEEGHRKGSRSETGHIRVGQTSEFHDDRHEEQDDRENENENESDGDRFKEDFAGITDAGRYIVDDVEYENTRDERDGRRRYRRFGRS